jgi:hypothetical protein
MPVRQATYEMKKSVSLGSIIDIDCGKHNISPEVRK